MHLKKCNVCKVEVSWSTRACPQCGAGLSKLPIIISLVSVPLLIMIAVVGFKMIRPYIKYKRHNGTLNAKHLDHMITAAVAGEDCLLQIPQFLEELLAVLDSAAVVLGNPQAILDHTSFYVSPGTKCHIIESISGLRHISIDTGAHKGSQGWIPEQFIHCMK